MTDARSAPPDDSGDDAARVSGLKRASKPGPLVCVTLATAAAAASFGDDIVQRTRSDDRDHDNNNSSSRGGGGRKRQRVFTPQIHRLGTRA